MSMHFLHLPYLIHPIAEPCFLLKKKAPALNVPGRSPGRFIT
jgi:hypothetical protein